MEGLPVVCYWTGAMNSVLDKLTKLNNHSNPADKFSMLTANLKEDLLGLKENFCDKLTGQQAKHKQVDVCMKQVRELVFKIEDWIDQNPESNLVVDPTQKFDYFKAKIHGARERFTRYFDLHKLVPTETDAAPIKITINPRLPVEEKYCFGIFDGPSNELVKYLTDEKEEMRKVVSVVGREGLGKTTLALSIYSKLQHRDLFQCQAFVSVGQRTPMMKILNNILSQINPRRRIFQDVRRIITQLREYLCTKRYFILVDGIQSTWAWKVINCALPNNHGSRVLITTSIVDVGRYCSSYPNDFVYQMEVLNKENSRILFLSKTVTLQKEEKWAGFEEDSCYMLKMCGGMPLAIIVAAGLLLARKSEALAELKMVGESIYSLKEYSPSEGLTKILQMSYADLSLPMKSCFLYLSVFPENYTINKHCLILLWEAEGFLERIDKEWSWLTGKRYFNELISRRLIQPVFTFEDDEPMGCTIHGVILDFIRSLSREENFTMTAAELNSGPFPCDTIRRFSLDCGNEDEADTLSTSSVHLSSMRSLIHLRAAGKLDPPVIGGFMDIFPFKLMRVLHLEVASNLQNHHLHGIGGLVLLRYLMLGVSGITRLPQDMGELERLETLDLSSSQHITLPASIVKLQKLTHVRLIQDAAGIWEMPELEVASGICAGSSSSFAKVVELLRKSQRLRMLGLTLTSASIPTEIDLLSFIDEVVKSKLQSLSLNCACYGDDATTLLVDSWEKVTASLGKIFEPQRFQLSIDGSCQYLVRVPPNMGSLATLTHLSIRLDVIESEGFLVLGSLTNLILLNLSAIDCPERRRSVIRKGMFPCLKVFSFRNEHSWMGLEFKGGAMPQLQRLERTFVVRTRWNQEYPDIGIEHLTCLIKVYATINCNRAKVSEVEAAEATIIAQLSKIATEPVLYFRRSGYMLQSQVSEGTSLRHIKDDDDQIWEDEGQHSIPVPSKSKLSQTRKDDDKHSVFSKKVVFQNAQK